MNAFSLDYKPQIAAPTAKERASTRNGLEQSRRLQAKLDKHGPTVHAKRDKEADEAKTARIRRVAL